MQVYKCRKRNEEKNREKDKTFFVDELSNRIKLHNFFNLNGASLSVGRFRLDLCV